MRGQRLRHQRGGGLLVLVGIENEPVAAGGHRGAAIAQILGQPVERAAGLLIERRARADGDGALQGLGLIIGGVETLGIDARDHLPQRLGIAHRPLLHRLFHGGEGGVLGGGGGRSAGELRGEGLRGGLGRGVFRGGGGGGGGHERAGLGAGLRRGRSRGGIGHPRERLRADRRGTLLQQRALLRRELAIAAALPQRRAGQQTESRATGQRHTTISHQLPAGHSNSQSGAPPGWRGGRGVFQPAAVPAFARIRARHQARFAAEATPFALSPNPARASP